MMIGTSASMHEGVKQLASFAEDLLKKKMAAATRQQVT